MECATSTAGRISSASFWARSAICCSRKRSALRFSAGCWRFPGAISLLAAFLSAIVYGLRPDAKWDAQFNAHTGRSSRSGWTVIFVVIFSLLFGAFLLMTGLALTFQTYFESQVEAAKTLSQ